MTQELNYGKRLHKAAREDFKAFWSAHRLWATFANAIAPLVLVAILATLRRSGNMVSVPWIVTIAVASFVISLFGNYIISMWRGAKTLDVGLHGQIEQRDKTITVRETEIQQKEQTIEALRAKSKRSDEEEHHFRKAQSALQKLPDHAKVALRHIWTMGELYPVAGGSIIIPGLTREQSNDALAGELVSSTLIKEVVTSHPSGDRHHWEITTGFRKVLGELLFPPPPAA